MEEWKEYKIGDIAKTNTSQYSLSEDWETIQYLDTGSITKNQISGIEKFFGNTDLPSRARRKVKHGDIVYSCVRPNLCHYGYIDNPPANLLVSTGFAVITVNPNLADARYIYYYLTQNNIVQSLHTIGEQAVSTYPSIKASDIEDLSISLPYLPIQHKIASILKSLDDKIELNRRINDNLEQQAQALFKSWFVDFEPFRDGEFVESELGMIPKGWRVCRADEVFEINIGKTPPRKESEWFTESKEDNVWVSIADMGSSGVFISDSSEYLTDEAIKRFNVLMVEKDSVLLSFKLTVGRVAIADTRLTTNEAIARFILPDKCYREFLYLYLKQYKYENLGSTSSIATAVNSKTIKGMKLIVPPTDIIESFSNNTRPLFEQIRSLQQESRRLAELRDTLLPKLMSGEIKV